MSDFGSKKKENHQNSAGNPFLRVRQIQKVQKIQNIQKFKKSNSIFASLFIEIYLIPHIVEFHLLPLPLAKQLAKETPKEASAASPTLVLGLVMLFFMMLFLSL